MSFGKGNLCRMIWDSRLRTNFVIACSNYQMKLFRPAFLRYRALFALAYIVNAVTEYHRSCPTLRVLPRSKRAFVWLWALALYLDE